jgi:hypothetical protein
VLGGIPILSPIDVLPVESNDNSGIVLYRGFQAQAARPEHPAAFQPILTVGRIDIPFKKKFRQPTVLTM